MVKVSAIIREERVEAVIERLVLLGIRGLTISPVKGAGPGVHYWAVFRGGEYQVHFASKHLLEWYGSDEQAPAIVRAIVHAASTGELGDGILFTQTVEQAIRIRTGERGPSAA